MDRIENDTSNNNSIVACLSYHGNLFTETLSSNRAIAQQLNHCLAMGYTRELYYAGLGTKNKNILMGPDGARDQERRCWGRIATICPTCPSGCGEQSVEAPTYLGTGGPNYQGVAEQCSFPRRMSECTIPAFRCYVTCHKCLCGIVTAVFSGPTIQTFRTQEVKKRQQGDLMRLLLFFRTNKAGNDLANTFPRRSIYKQR
jgi:hypothetical protein